MLQKFHCEHVLEELGNCGRYQKVLITCILFPLAMLAAFQSSTIYNELVSDHWCYVPAMANFSYGEQHRLIRPRLKTDLDYHLSEQLSQCEMYDIDYEEVISGLEVVVKSGNNESTIPIIPIPTKACPNGWVFNQHQYRQSAAMHYSFVCEHKDGIQRIKLIRKFASALLSPVYGLLADRYGRRVGFVLVLIAMIASATSPIFTTNYWAFLACQALNGSTIPISIFLVLIMGIEFMTPQYRSNVVLCAWLAFHLGEWIAFLMAQLLAHWAWIAACNSICVVPCLLLILFYTDETPQWILAQSKDSSRLRTTFEKLNKVNKAKLDEQSLNSIVSKFTHFADYKARQQQRTRSRQTHVKSAMEQFRVGQNSDDDNEQAPSFLTKAKLFLKRSTLFQMILLFAFVLMTNDLIIDFMHRERAKFNENLVIDSFFGSLIKMPAIVLTWYLIEQRIGRRWSNCVMLSINLTVLMVALFARWWFKKLAWFDVTISTLGVMLAECSTIITVLQVIELSPTRFRLIVLSLTYCIGKIASTSLIYAFNLYSLRILFNIYMRMTILLTLTLLSILIASFVAETRNEFLPLGLLASEQLITSVRFWSLSKKKSDITPSNLFLSLSKWDINSNHQIVGSIKHMEKFTDS